MKNPKVLVVTGDGINCEGETADSFKTVGFDVEIAHINDLCNEGLKIDQLSKLFSVLALPGGFSYGDDLGSGKVLALKIKYGLKWDLNQFVRRGGLVLGVCNGFQSLLKLGVFGKDVAITQNISGKFTNTWVKVIPHVNTKCVWLKGLGKFDLPIRHGEGRIVFHPEARAEALDKLERLGMASLIYEKNPNGSDGDLAGLCDTSGRIFGLMPHPEAFVRWTSHPDWNSQPDRAGAPGEGLAVFENALQEVRGSF